MSTKKKVVDKTPKEATLMTTFLKSISASSSWPDKDEFLDVVYWMRQIMGLAFGLIWGIFPLNGILAILLFFVINSLIVYLYYNTFQQVDEEEFGGVGEILKEGLMTSFATFLVSWIIMFSAIHHS
ncbi:hypothetical protein NP493_275g03015 [Ridgeia piscesae]|uniref:Rab5-interacting protein n=1 Tax=Ridgeia piscesae TaxID=27915 RepID=A0AAD9NXF6_RIDPI|nr:hypothetical protein NP493_275g03015 [Ridgeia piscesae]